jgi:hypothetical protein
MSDLKTLTALGTQVTIGDKKYRLRDLTRNDWALIEDRILSARGDPVAVAGRLAKDAPPEIARELYTKAYDDATKGKIVTAGELDAWRLSLDGLAFQFWLQIRKEHPEITEEEAADLLAQLGEEFLAEATEQLVREFPEATAEDVVRIALQKEEAGIAAIIATAAGLPEGNSATPAKRPGTPTSHSTGADGTPDLDINTDGPSSKLTG